MEEERRPQTALLTHMVHRDMGVCTHRPQGVEVLHHHGVGVSSDHEAHHGVLFRKKSMPPGVVSGHGSHGGVNIHGVLVVSSHLHARVGGQVSSDDEAVETLTGNAHRRPFRLHSFVEE